MFLIYLVLSIVAGLILVSLMSFLILRWLAKREPYRSFIHLRHRRKLTFFRLVLSDKRVPLYIKALPVAVVVYMVSPFDLVPGIIVDDVALALLALVLILKLTPQPVVLELIQRAQSADAPSKAVNKGFPEAGDPG